MALAIVIMLIVRAFMFTIYAVPTEKLAPILEKGDRVIVNRLQNVDIKRGDIIIFHDKADYIGIVEGIPGDTLKIQDECFVIPKQCFYQGCLCDGCKYFMVNIGMKRQLVNKTKIIGKARKLFHL